jgi:hypothetical protein
MKKSMNRDFPLSPTPKGSEVSFSGPIKPMARVNSDSLMLESNRNKYFAYEQERIAKGQIKRDGGNEPLRYRDANQRVVGPSGNERMQIAKKARQSASADSAMAVRTKIKPKK